MIAGTCGRGVAGLGTKSPKLKNPAVVEQKFGQNRGRLR